MQSLALTALLSLAGLAASSPNPRRVGHRHGHLHVRDYASTVVEMVTTWKTEFVYADGSPAEATSSSTTSTTSSSSTTTTSESTSSQPASLAPGIFLQKSEAPTPAPPVQTQPPSPAPIPTTPPAPVNDFPLAPGERAFTVINMHTAAISTGHDSTEGRATSAGADVVAGTMAAGATATYAVKPGYIGNVAINDAKYPLTPNSTLIESNFVPWFADGIPRADFDISFVNGFTLPAVCSCNGVVTTGCNVDLNAIAECPLGIHHGACANPLRASFVATEASSFFRPCQGAAWTFVNDGEADSNCANGPIVCCIGTACPANPKQG